MYSHHNLETREKMSEKRKEYYKNNPEAIEQKREFIKGDKNPAKRPEVAKKLMSDSAANTVFCGAKSKTAKLWTDGIANAISPRMNYT